MAIDLGFNTLVVVVAQCWQARLGGVPLLHFWPLHHHSLGSYVSPQSPPLTPPPPLFSGRCQDFLGSDCQIGGPNVTTATTTSHIQPRESHVTIHMGRKVTMRQCFVLCVKYRA